MSSAATSTSSTHSEDGDDYQLEIGSRIGTGVYGIVYRAVMGDREIALKRNVTSTPVGGIATLKELDALTRLRGHPFIVGFIKPIFTDRGTSSTPAKPFTDNIGRKFRKSDGDDKVHFIMELENTNLADAAKRGISYTCLKRIVTQLMLGVEWMAANGICHRDLKTNNVLYNRDSLNPRIRICDFGLATHAPYHDMFFNTPGLVTSWYRAPEVCIGADYTTSIDVWSAATIMFELVAKRALLKDVSDDDAEIIAALLRRVPGIVTEEEINAFCGGCERGSINRVTVDDIKRLMTKYEISIPKDSSRAKVAASFREATKLTAKEAQDFERQTGSTLLEYCDLIGLAATFVPANRPSAKVLLDSHPFFANPETRALIEATRAQFKPDTSDFDPDVSIRPGEFRNIALSMISKLWNNRSQIEWYDSRVIFHAIDALDRYNAMRSSVDLYDGETKDDVFLKVYTVCYLYHKFFVSLGDVETWESFAPKKYSQEASIIAMDDFEDFVVKDICANKLFRNTVIETLIARDGRERSNNVREAIVALTGISKPWSGKLSKLFETFIEPVLT